MGKIAQHDMVSLVWAGPYNFEQALQFRNRHTDFGIYQGSWSSHCRQEVAKSLFVASPTGLIFYVGNANVTTSVSSVPEMSSVLTAALAVLVYLTCRWKLTAIWDTIPL